MFVFLSLVLILSSEIVRFSCFDYASFGLSIKNAVVFIFYRNKLYLCCLCLFFYLQLTFLFKLRITASVLICMIRGLAKTGLGNKVDFTDYSQALETCSLLNMAISYNL